LKLEKAEKAVHRTAYCVHREKIEDRGQKTETGRKKRKTAKDPLTYTMLVK